jgi:hypothetical protein
VAVRASSCSTILSCLFSRSSAAPTILGPREQREDARRPAGVRALRLLHCAVQLQQQSGWGAALADIYASSNLQLPIITFSSRLNLGDKLRRVGSVCGKQFVVME